MDMNFDFDEQIEKLAKVPKPIQMAAVAGLLVVLGVAYYFTSYQSVQAELVKTRAQSQELQRKLNKVRAVANNLTDFRQEVAGLERELELALKQLPNRKQFEDLLQDISTAGKKVGVQIKSIERQPEALHDFYAEVPFKLEIEGSYHNIARFFDRVSKLPRIVNVGSLRMSVATESSSSTVLRVEGTASTFRFLGEDETDQQADNGATTSGRRA
ncbi:MAG: type 4a pilus biogenesis protein PilO [Myxococcota bacterium]